MSVQQPKPVRKRLSLQAVVLLLMVALLIAFCVQNLQPVQVWPFQMAPLFVVILVAFALGLGIGWLAGSFFGGRRSGPSDTVRKEPGEG